MDPKAATPPAPPSTIEATRDFWDAHARRDPLWAILSEPSKRDGQWDLDRFLQTGVAEISFLLYELAARHITVGRGAALDFGCGVGRLTQALAPHFAAVVGVDVSATMIAHARRLNRHPSSVSYTHNDTPDLRGFADGTFDLVYSNIVLQHIHPDISLVYLREFFRVLRPAGLLVFQLPSHRRGPEDPPPTPAVRAMPDEAYRARLALVGTPSVTLRPGAARRLDVAVTNESAVAWSADTFGLIRVGNHWLDGAGARMLQRDDGRTPLPAIVLPGETVVVSLPITAPDVAGHAVCAVDLAHEGVQWFADKRSPDLRFPVRIESADASGAGDGPAPDAGPDAGEDLASPEPERTTPRPALDGVDVRLDDPGDFPMYGIETGVVLALIGEHRGALLARDDDRSCGTEWVSYRYIVRAAG